MKTQQRLRIVICGLIGGLIGSIITQLLMWWLGV